MGKRKRRTEQRREEERREAEVFRQLHRRSLEVMAEEFDELIRYVEIPPIAGVEEEKA